MNARHDPVLDYATPLLGPGMAVPIVDFLDWVERQEGKYEYDRGTIGMMVENTQNHAVLVSRFLFSFMSRIADPTLQVLAESFGVHTGASVRFPDVLVQRAGADGKSRRSQEPLGIIEVSSPSSIHLDRVVKRDEYLSLPSLQFYVVASQDEPAAEVWMRTPGGRMPNSPQEIKGLDAVIELTALNVALPLAEIYRGIR